MKRLWNVLVAVLCGLSLAPGVSRAGWIYDGIPLTTPWSSAAYAAVSPDGASGEIVAFQACYFGVTKVIAQRIDSNGDVLWPSSGIVLGDGNSPAMIPDGAGGAIVAWEIDRGGGLDIYAQRIDADGSPLWAENGVPVCSASGDQSETIICSDASGGAVVAWWDNRGGETALFVQRLDGEGSVLWATDGVAVCTATGEKRHAQMASLGMDGVVIAWEDSRGASVSNIYAQRLDAAGIIQWTTDGVAVCPAASIQQYPRVAPDGASGAIVAWVDMRRWSDIYAQRLNASGAAEWTADGVRVCDSPSYQWMPDILAGGSGGAIVVWSDHRDAAGEDIYAQRLDADGAVQWSSTGVPVCTATGDQMTPSLVTDASGGAIVIWADGRSGEDDVYAQRVNASGNAQWTPDGVAVVTAEGEQASRWIVSDGAGGAIVTWHELGYAGPLHAQRIDDAGSPVWTAGGAALTSGTSRQLEPAMVSNGSGGSIVAWMQMQDGYSYLIGHDIMAQVVSGSGDILGAGEGTTVCAAPGDQAYPTIVSDGSGGAIIAWQDARNGNGDIFAQRMDGSGNILWPEDGILACISGENESSPQIVSDGAGGAIIAWLVLHSGSNDIGAQRVSASGALLWGPSGIVICNAAGDQSGIAMASDGAGGAILAWTDGRNGSYSDLYAQHVNASGVAQWGTNGTAICTSPGDQVSPHVALDAGGWITIVWTDDQRDGAPDIYAQRLNPSGVPQWQANGLPISTDAGAQRAFALLSGGSIGMIIAWVSAPDLMSQLWDIHARCVSPSGAIEWTATAVSGRTNGGNGSCYRACADDAGGVTISWHEYREGSQLDIYAQWIDADGAVRWGTEGSPVSTASGSQWFPCMASDVSGGTILAWQDVRCPTQHIYAQRLSPSGYPIATTLMGYAAHRDGGSIRLEWVLSRIDGDAAFSILRSASPNEEFEELGEIAIAANGLSFSCTDESCRPGVSYRYRVDYRSADGGTRTLFETEDIAVPAVAMTLYQNYPNPFNPITEIRFLVPEAGAVSLAVYDVAGKLVRVLVDARLDAGPHDAIWDGRDEAGHTAATGIYFYRLQAGKETISRKMVLLR
jgi:hypothetical protein